MRCERLEEPGVGQGVPSKIGRNLFKHPNSFGFYSGELSTIGFGASAKVAVGLRGSVVELPSLRFDLMMEFSW